MKKRIVIALVAFALGFLAAFYARFEMLSNQLEADGLRGGAANAIKHAYAAAEVYDTLRTLRLPPHESLQAVIYLGYANEYAEKITKFAKLDPHAEIKKDLYNNLAGITVARWHETHGNQPVLNSLITLAKKETLVVERENLPFDGPANPFAWFDGHRVDIQQRVESGLSGQ